MALTKTTREVVNIPTVSIALANDLTANGINVLKAPNLSPAFTGIPTAPTAADSINTTQLATTAFVHNVIASEFETGTRTIFFQTAAPTGWTQILTSNDYMLRVVSTAGGGTGGTHSPILMNVVPSHTHTMTGTTTSAGAHTHSYLMFTPGAYGVGTHSTTPNAWANNNYTASSGDHNHTISAAISNNSGAANWTPKYMNMINCNKI